MSALVDSLGASTGVGELEVMGVKGASSRTGKGFMICLVNLELGQLALALGLGLELALRLVAALEAALVIAPLVGEELLRVHAIRSRLTASLCLVLCWLVMSCWIVSALPFLPDCDFQSESIALRAHW